MKRYETENGTYLYGPTKEVKELFKSIKRAADDSKTNFVIPYDKPPIFAKRKKVYALHIDNANNVRIISSDEMMDILFC